jgi:hypothetical protein
MNCFVSETTAGKLKKNYQKAETFHSSCVIDLVLANIHV